MKKIFALLITLFLILGGVPIAEATPDADKEYLSPDTISAKSAILINGSDGSVYFEKNADLRLGMASTTKIMTALTALSLCSADEILTVPKEAVGIEGSSIYLVEGEKLSLRELLYALLLSSANDAAAAIAICVSGSIGAFSEEMNALAKSMGLVATHFTNPHGLYDEDHYTTARELAIIGKAALENDLIREIVKQRKATISHDGESDMRLLVNHNRLLAYYEGAIGVKTGYTKATGRTLVSAAERNGLTLIAVTLDAPDDWRDHKAMLDHGFDTYRRVELFQKGRFTYQLPLCGGRIDAIKLVNSEPIVVTLRQDAPEYTVTVEAPTRFLTAPVSRGQSFGSVTVKAEGAAVNIPLEISENAPATTKVRQGFFERIINFFKID